VVVRPAGAVTGLLLAQADGPDQAAVMGRQATSRVGFFLRVDDFDAARQRMMAAGVEFIGSPRTEPYGQVAVFRDIAATCGTCSGRRRASPAPHYQTRRTR